MIDKDLNVFLVLAAGVLLAALGKQLRSDLLWKLGNFVGAAFLGAMIITVLFGVAAGWPH